MRHVLFAGLAIWIAVSAVAADAPIPQDAARIAQRRRERLEWNRSTLGGAYDKVGKRDPRWDKPARQAMDLAARMFSEEVGPQVTSADVYKPAKAAVDAGCDDPLLLYLYHRTQQGPDYPGEEESARRMKQTAKALAASRYPGIRRAIGLKQAGSYALWAEGADEAARKQAEKDLDAALALLRESFASDERNFFWRDQWFAVASEVLADYRKLGVEPPAACARVEAALAKVPELKALQLKVRGIFWVGYAWEARGNAVAALVGRSAF